MIVADELINISAEFFKIRHFLFGNDIAFGTKCGTYRFSRTRVIYRTKKSATSATSVCNLLNHRILRVHFDFWKMLLEKLLEGVSTQMRICALLCRNETYRKVTARLFYMSHREIFMRRRLFKKWRRLFEKRRRRFEKSR